MFGIIVCTILFSLLLLRYLNSQYGDKSGNSSWMEMTPYSFGIEFQERPLEIGPVGGFSLYISSSQ